MKFSFLNALQPDKPLYIRKAAHEAGIWLLRPWEYISLKISSESNLIQPATCLTITLGILYLLLEKCVSWNHIKCKEMLNYIVQLL